MEETEQLAFHRKYRPKKLIEYVGNTKVKETMLNAIGVEPRPQVILIDGHTGCGKTSLARLIAKEYRCLDRDGASGACGVCANCIAMEGYISTGQTDELTDIQEVDIAKENGKQDIDRILEEVDYPSFGGQTKIYIFDECHRASKEAQNRLLKVAEEPPEGVLLIFCTTEPERMLETLKNRCQLQLHIKRPTVTELTTLLKKVCMTEGKKYDMKGLRLIANRSNLTIRTALNMLETIIAQHGIADYGNVTDALDEVSETILFDFYRKLLNKDTLGYVSLLHKIKTSMELGQFVNSLTEFTMRGVYIYNNINLDGMTKDEMKVYKDLFSRFTVEEIATLLDKLQSLKGGDMELKLLMMGYTGLHKEVVNTEADNLVVDKVESELAKEKNEHLKNVEESFKPDEKEVEIRKQELSENMSFDDITALFGNVEVEEIPK